MRKRDDHIQYAATDGPYSGGPFVPEQYLRPGLTVAQLIAILRARWMYSVVIAVLVIAASVGVAFLLPRSYTSTATLMVAYENRDPLAGEQLPMALMGSYVATQIELIGSPVVLLPVVEHLKLDTDPEFVRGYKGTPEAVRDYVAADLRRNLLLEEGRGGQIIYVTATAKSAGRAAQVANAVADMYLSQERERAGEPADERAKRYSEQLGELREKVAAAQDKVAQFRSHSNLTNVASNREVVDPEVQLLGDMERRLAEAQAQRRAAEVKASEATDTGDAAMASHTLEALKAQISGAELELSRLRGQYVASNPRITELESQVATMRQSLASEQAAIGANARGRLKSARELEAGLERDVAAERKKVLGVQTLGDEGARLLLELDSAQAVYKKALDGYDQIMFASSSQSTPTSIISRATPPAKASKPSRVRLVLMGLVAGLGLGLIVPILFDLLLHRRVLCRDDIEYGAGVRVLGELVALPRPTRSS